MAIIEGEVLDGRWPRFMFPQAALAQAALARALLQKRRRRFRFGDEPYSGEELYGIETLDGRFLPGLGKFFRKVGKVTSPITGAIAKRFLPSSVVDAMAKADPTRRGSSPQAAATAVQQALLPDQPGDTMGKVKDFVKKNPLVIAAGGGVLLLLLIKK